MIQSNSDKITAELKRVGDNGKCILCDNTKRPIIKTGVFEPKHQESFMAPPGKLRVFCYALCDRHPSPLSGFELAFIEKRLYAGVHHKKMIFFTAEELDELRGSGD